MEKLGKRQTKRNAQKLQNASQYHLQEQQLFHIDNAGGRDWVAKVLVILKKSA